MAVTGRARGTVVGDRGFGTVANDQAMEAVGVKRVGLRRTRLRRLGGARTWVGLGIFAYNLQRMTVVAG
jgi:IS5 family transposase